MIGFDPKAMQLQNVKMRNLFSKIWDEESDHGDVDHGHHGEECSGAVSLARLILAN